MSCAHPAQPPLYTVAEQGRMIARQLHMDLPLSVREKAVAAALSLLALARSKRENQVEVEEIEEGFIVTCHISGGEVELMRFSLYAPDRYQANLIEQSFHRSPQTVYQVMLALMTSHENQISGLLAKRNGGSVTHSLYGASNHGGRFSCRFFPLVFGFVPGYLVGKTAFVYRRFLSPHSHIPSRIGIRDLLRSVRPYFAFGGICGYPSLCTNRSDPNSLSVERNVLQEISPLYFSFH